jgi:outer membrane murein-binding lipoprotein Lpp
MSKRVSLSIVASLTLGGCFWATTKSEGEALRKDVKSLQDRLNTKEAALDDQIGQLKKVLEDSSKLLKRNSADLGADVDQLRNDVRTANGLVTAMNNTYNELKAAFDAYKKSNDQRLERLEERLGQIESGKPSAASSPEELWRLGCAAFQASRYNDASEIFWSPSTFVTAASTPGWSLAVSRR